MAENPFVFGSVTYGANFTDRKEESHRLLQNFNNGVNTLLISPRRIGKTSLVRRVSEMAEPSLKFVFIDIFSCRSEAEFYETFATSVIKQTSSKLEEALRYIKEFLSRLNPQISLSPDKVSEFSLSFGVTLKDESILDIMRLPEMIAEKKGYRIVICIDEFQQIGEFADSELFQRKLRTSWQHHRHVCYCLYGSKKHLMNELFEKRNKPFYKFCDVINLGKISTENWVEYICGQFESGGKHISPELAEKICTLVENHSSYVQHLSWLVWLYTDQSAGEKELELGFEDLLNQNSILFERQTENLSSYQLNFLRALVLGVDSEFTKQEVLSKYKLGSSANVSAIKKALIRKELIDTENRKTFIVDPVLKHWLKRLLRT